MEACFVVRAQVADAAAKGDFDRRYPEEQLPDARDTFKTRRRRPDRHQPRGVRRANPATPSRPTDNWIFSAHGLGQDLRRCGNRRGRDFARCNGPAFARRLLDWLAFARVRRRCAGDGLQNLARDRSGSVLDGPRPEEEGHEQ